MPDAGSSAPAKPKATGLAKTPKSGTGLDGGSDSKKRFEVKKVSFLASFLLESWVFGLLICFVVVECCGALGLGYRCG